MDHQQQRCRKKINQKQGIDLKDSFLGGGFMCDLNVKFNAYGLPGQDRTHSHKTDKKNRSMSPELYTELKKYLGKSLNALSKEELTDYVLTLLLKRPLESHSGDVQCPQQNGSIEESIPEDISRSLPCSNDMTDKSCQQSLRTGNRRCYKTANSDENQCFEKGLVGKSTNRCQNESRADQDQSYFNKIITAIDLLCDMRTLFDKKLIESAGTMVGETAQSVGGSCNNRRISVNQCKESDAMRCNKRVQTEASSTCIGPDGYKNFQRGQDYYHREYVNANSAFCEDAQQNITGTCTTETNRNMYNRFPGSSSYLQPPYALTTPSVNLNTYRKYRCNT